MPFGEQITTLLATMREQAEQTARETEDHWVRARSLDPNAAELLSLLARSAQAKNILEIGTSVGYSTIHLALAAQETGGHVTTLELLPTKVEAARANLAKGGLTQFVTQRQGDALEFLPSMPGPWDLVFLDPEKELYVPAWERFKDNVRPGGLVVADNVLSHADDLKGYLEAVRADGRFDTITVPIGLGLEVSYRRP